MLTLLTPTGARPEAWAICERLMAAQDYAGPVRWVIVDDGPQPQPVTFKRDGWQLVVIRPAPFWQPGQNTQARNLAKGMEAVPADARLVIIEDDDSYRADWLSHVDRQLDRAELVGECQARYYNLTLRRGRQLSNNGHASLCSTAMRGAALATFRRELKPGVQFIDVNLWRRHPSRHLFTGGRVVGMKGLPGRGGIGMGHRNDFRGTADPDLTLLRRWIGENVELYA